MMNSYRKLKVWQKAMEMVDGAYVLSRRFPKEEIYGLTSQFRRSAISVASNIAEGSQRNSEREFVRFINIAYASLAEVETQAEVARRQDYITDEQLEYFFRLTAETGKMLNGLRTSILQKFQFANCELQTAN